jgi:polyferredoxin
MGHSINMADNNWKASRRTKLLTVRNLRRTTQVLCFVGFVYLFLATVHRFDTNLNRPVLPSRAPIDTFFRIDPLLGLSAMLSARRVIEVMLVYALPVVLLSIVAGRFFCGWICPLGTAIDATSTIFFRNRRAAEPNRHFANVKYYVLAAIITAAVFGGQIAYFLDPITIITRAFTFSIYPVAQLTGRSFGHSEFISERLPFLISNTYLPNDVLYYYRLNFVAAAMLIGVLGAEVISRRFWCRNLCPLGAMLGVMSRFSVVRRLVANTCVACPMCMPKCKMGAILDNPTQYQANECIYCYNCTQTCPTLSTRIVPTIRKEGYRSTLDLSRRRTVLAMGAGALVAVMARTNIAAKTAVDSKIKVSDAGLIRPPGSLPEEEFVDRCIRCSECMKVCPTGGLQPALTEAGLEGLWTPVLVPRIGECAQNCNLCSQVCSSHAIQRFEIDEKPHIYIGTAAIDRSLCIMWNFDECKSSKRCLVCDECCSYRAVYWQYVDDIKRPFIDEHKCVGCGICENKCPIQPISAIRVFSYGDQRHKTREEQKAFYESGQRKE